MELRSTVTFVLGVLVFVADLGCGAADITTTVYPSLDLRQATANTFLNAHRKLTHRGSALADAKLKRRVHDKCGKYGNAIEISQAATAPLPSGIPTYTVEIMNRCVSGCNISNIHLSCGWFSSARLINPTIFKRLRYNDCLVNAGKPLRNGAILSFQYANTHPYPLSVSSLLCR